MLNFLIGLAVISFVIRIGLKMMLFALRGKRKNRKNKRSLLGKVIYLATFRMHQYVDGKIELQKENLAVKQGLKTNVIKFSNHKRKAN